MTAVVTALLAVLLLAAVVLGGIAADLVPAGIVVFVLTAVFGICAVKLWVTP